VRIDWDGEQSRDYVYVGDVVRANLAALSRGSGEIYVIGTGKKTTVNDVYKALVKATGFQAPITKAPRRPGDARDVYFNPAKAARELGWKAEKDLTTGIADTVAYFRDRLATAPASIA
jgi:UDP-glucose 4-epimerase